MSAKPKKRENVRFELMNKNTSRLSVLDSGDIDIEKREVCLTYSSDVMTEMWFGQEILSHRDGAQKLDRISGRGPLLLNHDTNRHIGVVVEAKVEGGKGKALVRFSRSEEGERAFQDVIDKILVNVSCRYKYLDVELTEEGEKREDGMDVYTVNKYEIMEISLVSIPADIGVGVGRSFEDVNNRDNGATSRQALENRQTENENKEKEMSAKNKNKESVGTTTTSTGGDELRSQMLEILEIGEKFGMGEQARKFIENGKSVESFRQAVLDKFDSENKVIKPNNTTEEIGLSDKEKRSYNILGAIRAAATGNWKGMEFEREVSETAKREFNRDTSGILIPTDILRYGSRRIQVSDQTIQGQTVVTGGSFVEDELRPDSFIDMLRNKLVVRQLGAQVLDSLKGNLSVPRQTGGATAYWVTEGSDIQAESNQTTDQVSMSPKSVGSYTDISRKLLLQESLSVQQFVMNDLSSAVSREIDRASIFSDGKNGSPIGVVEMPGVKRINAGSANGGRIGYTKLVEMETEVATANAELGSLAYLTNAKVRGQMKTTLKAEGVASGYIWEGNDGRGGGFVNGYRTAVSNMVPSDLKKGNRSNLSACIYGNFNDIVIGEWGLLDIQVNPYGPGAASGNIRVRVLQDVDIAVRHPESFAVMLDIQTS